MDPVSLIVGFCLIVFAIVVIAVASPVARGRWRPDRLLGVKTEPTAAAEATALAVCRYAGRQFMAWSFPVLLVGGALLVIPLKTLPALAFGCMAVPGLCYFVAIVRVSVFAAKRSRT